MTLALGQVLVCSWGYDQTNVDFYEVTKVGKATVEITPIAQERSDGRAWATGTCTPLPGKYIGKPRRKRPARDNLVRIASYAWARPWDGEPENWTAYA